MKSTWTATVSKAVKKTLKKVKGAASKVVEAAHPKPPAPFDPAGVDRVPGVRKLRRDEWANDELRRRAEANARGAEARATLDAALFGRARWVNAGPGWLHRGRGWPAARGWLRRVL